MMSVMIPATFKRFCFRPAPYLVKRGKMHREYEESSVVCCEVVNAIIMCYMGAYAHKYAHPKVWYEGWYPVTVFLFVIFAGFARIYLGTTYPSDTVAGAIVGWAICFLGAPLYKNPLFGCPSCAWDECYECSPCLTLEGGSRMMHELGTMNNLNLLVVFLGSFLYFLLCAVLILKPLHFWKKVHHCLGITTACLLFQMAYLCPSLSANGTSSLSAPNMSLPVVGFGLLWAVVSVAILTAIGVLSERRKMLRLAGFVALFVLTVSSIVGWRLGVANVVVEAYLAK
eukprot:JP446666.1.p1 GENE.JP446666.1~~JP446666.1.p1  ORF type:complete len:284 (+),score=47.61 JP446666.1:1-852(+)